MTALMTCQGMQTDQTGVMDGQFSSKENQVENEWEMFHSSRRGLSVYDDWCLSGHSEPQGPAGTSRDQQDRDLSSQRPVQAC